MNRILVTLLLLMVSNSGPGFGADVAAPPPRTAAPPPTAAAGPAKIPAADLIKKYVQAIGGREAILRHSSHHSTGTFEMPAQGLKGTLEVFAKKPDKMLVRVEVPGYGLISQGYNGTIGWSIDPAIGPQLLKGKQLDQLKDEASFYSVLHEGEEFKSMEITALTEFESQPCYQLRVIRKSGHETTEYFNRLSSLLVGSTSTNESPFGPIVTTTVASDYKKFGDILTPANLVQKVLGMAQIMTISRLEYDRVSDSSFDLPPQIAALIEK